MSGCSPRGFLLLLSLGMLGATVLLLTGCATALKRESDCLLSLTPDVIQAHDELSGLEASWHEALHRQGATWTEVTWLERQRAEETFAGAERSYKTLTAARVRYRPLLQMYDRVYQRVRQRTDEETILSQVRTVLLTGPASLIFYPIIRWNVRTVLWDGVDPDADTDVVTRFCRERLGQTLTSTDRLADDGTVSSLAENTQPEVNPGRGGNVHPNRE